MFLANEEFRKQDFSQVRYCMSGAAPFPVDSMVDLGDRVTQVPIGEEGELICSGPQVMNEYLNKAEETKNALREQDGMVWMHTGDVGRMDEDGFVYVVDRAKDMIIVGGYKVFSSEVEGKLYKHPDSEIVKLFVQKSEAYAGKPDEAVKEEIIAFAKEKLAPCKVPKIVEFIDTIPLIILMLNSI